MLEFKNVTKIYASNKGIRNCSWSVNEKEVVGILGNNGCGKTTSFKLLLGLEDCDGMILYKNKDIRKYDLSIFGYVPEDRTLYHDVCINDFLTMIGRLKKIDSKSIQKVIDDLLYDFHIYSYKYKRVDELSKGNQQVLQIICAIMHEPEILILDEPFNGVDQQKRLQIIKYLRNRTGITLLSFHQSQLVSMVCDKVIYLNDGEVNEIIEVKHD